MKSTALFASCCVLGLAASSAESKLKLSELPLAVRTAVNAQSRGATILGASKEQEQGRLTYEVATQLDGKSRDLTFDESGSLLEVEQEVSLDSIPAAAKEAIRKRASGGTVSKVESVTPQGSNTSYEAAVKSKAGKRHEIAVNADGTPHIEH